MQLAPGHEGACYLYLHVMESVVQGARCAGRLAASAPR